ncbi:hypothetical protein BDB00DRAFT_811106 [Zychaea mexicana]|uniref:uncharacterized protein n=1 Tax=Zychaea mexicana TaxID=64656 RepID=UPI0022FDCC6A|nr:uncharacterized protein BDB00DRAFT_811106 [Zychaea mexicana]KAI9495954.1 hypothetical protein BDB00DRAFT_811106 [Zychaea mexicana]
MYYPWFIIFSLFSAHQGYIPFSLGTQTKLGFFLPCGTAHLAPGFIALGSPFVFCACTGQRSGPQECVTNNTIHRRTT